MGATASLILSIYTNVIPFMADESMMAISPGTKLKYDKKTYFAYVDKLIAKCAILKEKMHGKKNENDDEAKDEETNDENGDGNAFVVTPFILGECLWTKYMMEKYGDIDVETENVDESNANAKAKTKNRKKQKMSQMRLLMNRWQRNAKDDVEK